MKILHVITGLEVGGAEYILLRFIQTAKRQANDEHVVISLTTQGVLGEQLNALGVKVFALDMSGIQQFLRAFLQLRRLIKELSPDLVQTWLYHADFLAGVAARTCGIRYVVWGVHSTEVPFLRYPTTAILRLVCAALSYVVPKAIWCVAERSAEKHKSIGFDKRKFVVIPNGFDLAAWQFDPQASVTLRARLNIPTDAFLIGSVGRYNPDKDHDTLLRAFSCLLKKQPNARLVLVGKGLDAGNLELAEQLSQADLLNNVSLLGLQTNLPEIMSGFDIFCLHSKTEAFPLVLGEAMALGILCVTTDVGDAAFLLNDKSQTVVAESPELLADVLYKSALLSDAEKKQKVLNAKSRIAELFSLEQMVERVTSMYLSILRKSD